MEIVVESDLGYDRFDASTGKADQPFDLHLTVHGAAHQPAESLRDLMTLFVDIYASQACRLHCTMYAINRNAVSVVVTTSGWERWKKGIVNAEQSAHRNLCNHMARDVLSIVQTYLKAHKAEGECAANATCDVFFPCGERVYWAGHV